MRASPVRFRRVACCGRLIFMPASMAAFTQQASVHRPSPVPGAAEITSLTFRLLIEAPGRTSLSAATASTPRNPSLTRMRRHWTSAIGTGLIAIETTYQASVRRRLDQVVHGEGLDKLLLMLIEVERATIADRR